jgi:hypothetical protein
VQVGAADGAGGEAHHRVGRLLDLRVGDLVEADVADPVEHDSSHGSLLWKLMVAGHRANPP